MRTTLTLEDDVAEQLKAQVTARGLSFKQIVNDLLRAGLKASTRQPAKRYKLKPASLGAARGVDLDAGLRLADALEDEGIARKLELRK